MTAALAIGCSIRHPGEPPAPSNTALARAAAGDTIPPGAQVHMAVPADSAAIRAIVTEGMQRSHASSDLEYLTDVIGPRVSGSPNQLHATAWTLQKFREYGMDSAWTEPFRFGQVWERGPISLTLLAPHIQQLIGASWAWAPGTPGPETGDVIYVSARTPAEYAAEFAATVRGKWVMIRAPAFVWNSDGPPMARADSAQADSVRAENQALTASPDLEQYRGALPYLVARDGALGIIVDGAKEFTLLTMSGSPVALYPLPSFVIPHESYAMIYRLAAAGERVSLRADIANSLSKDTVNISNTIGELRGTQTPEEVVLLGAHLDSWDLGTGATDNGAGAMAVLEAARILRAAHVRPARTIRFVLFTGEEEGLFGSEEYAARHGAELRRYQAVLVLDNGTGRITGVSLQGRNELRDLWQSLFAPITVLGPFVVQSRNKGGTDHLSFLPYGVPAFNFDQESRGYGHTHHSQADTYEHIVAGDVRQAATVMAVTAYELAGLPQLIGRGPVSVVVGAP
jgi:hypothetical protein